MKIIKEGAGHNPRAWLVSFQDMYGDDIEDVDITDDLEYTLGEIDLKSLGFTDNIEEAKEQVIPHESRLAEFKLEFGYYGDELEMEVKSGDIGDFIDKMIAEQDEKMLEIFKSLPSAKTAIEEEKKKFKEKYNEDLDDFEAIDAISFITSGGENLEKEFNKFTETEVADLRSKVQAQLKKVFGDKLRVATGAWTSSQVENKRVKESLKLRLESKSNEEVASIITKIADLEAEFDILSQDKEVDQKDLKSIKDKIYRLNKKLNEDKMDTDEENLKNIKVCLQSSGIKNPRTLELMSKDVLKDLNTKYDKDTKDSNGLYYNVTIVDAIQKKIEQITGKKPGLTFGKTESKLREDKDNNYVIEISYKNSKNKKLTTTSYLKKMLDMKDAEEPGKQPYVATANEKDALKMDSKTAERYIKQLTKSYPDYTVKSIKLDTKNEARKNPDKMLFASKSITEALSVREVTEELPIYLRINSEGLHYVQLSDGSDTAQKPEDYDEGYITGWEKGKDPAYDKEQERRFQEATKAYEDGEVYMVRDIKDDSIEAYLYGDKELEEWLKEVKAEKVNIEELMK